MSTVKLFFAATVLLISCAEHSSAPIENNNGVRTDTIGTIYFLSDSSSRIIISYSECTECLDAYVDSGNVYIPESVMREIKSIYDEKGAVSIPSPRDLYLTGEDKIAETLFGDSTNYGQLWGNRYEVTGKAVGIKGLGIIFRVDSYRLLKNSN